MRSRMERYHHEENSPDLPISRSDKNQQLYRDLGKNTKYTNFTDVSKVNAVELDTSSQNCRTRAGYHQIKDYEDLVEKPQVKKELDEFNYLYQDHENRVYDINSVLKEAKENRKERDELEKKRKLKNTNYNILASLDPEELEKYRLEKQQSIKPDPDELRELIDTITSNTLKDEIKNESQEGTSADLLDDLMATSATDQVNLDDLELSKQIQDQDFLEQATNHTKSKSELDNMDQSFYTRSMDLSDKDFELEEDDDDDSNKIPMILKIFLVLLICAIVGIAIYFVVQFI